MELILIRISMNKKKKNIKNKKWKYNPKKIDQLLSNLKQFLVKDIYVINVTSHSLLRVI